jgi:hypothetical protein
MALDVRAGDEVVVPAFSFFATAGVVARLGAVPVFADVEPGTLTLAPEDFASKVTPRTRAVIPVHLYGQAADLEPILEIARRRGIRVVEDACVDRRPVPGSGGRDLRDAERLFFPTKNSGAGDAGLTTEVPISARDSGGSGCMEWSPNTSMRRSAATSGSTRSRRRSCA